MGLEGIRGLPLPNNIIRPTYTTSLTSIYQSSTSKSLSSEIPQILTYLPRNDSPDDSSEFLLPTLQAGDFLPCPQGTVRMTNVPSAFHHLSDLARMVTALSNASRSNSRRAVPSCLGRTGWKCEQNHPSFCGQAYLPLQFSSFFL